MRCWLADGNRVLGYAKAACVGNLNYAGTVYRFKMIGIPLGPRRFVEHFTVPGVSKYTDHARKAATFPALDIR